jgi:hypothetical protein
MYQSQLSMSGIDSSGRRPPSYCEIQVLNTTGSEIKCGYPIGIKWGMKPDPSESSDVAVISDFVFSTLYLGVKPDDKEAFNEYAVTIEHIPKGKIGRAVRRGIVPARVVFKHLYHSYAHIAKDTKQLVSVPGGSAKILWSPEKEDEQWCIVELVVRDPMYFRMRAKLEAFRMSEAEDAILCDATGSFDSDNKVLFQVRDKWGIAGHPKTIDEDHLGFGVCVPVYPYAGEAAGTADGSEVYRKDSSDKTEPGIIEYWIETFAPQPPFIMGYLYQWLVQDDWEGDDDAKGQFYFRTDRDNEILSPPHSLEKPNPIFKYFWGRKIPVFNSADFFPSSPHTEDDDTSRPKQFGVARWDGTKYELIQLQCPSQEYDEYEAGHNG